MTYHPLVVPLTTDRVDESTLTGRICFSRIHLGSGGAAHGGVHPLLFDEVLGTLAGWTQGSVRTASCTSTTGYRQP